MPSSSTATATAHSSLLSGSHQNDGGPDCCYEQQQQRHQGDLPHGDTPEVFRQEAERRETYTWRVTDFGTIGARSRDGSIHATDEVFNAASHLSATMLSVLGSVLLITESSAEAEPWKIVSFSLYGASLIFLFACSTLHHSIEGSPKVESFFRMMDYLAIYPLIAGTFTPLCLVFYHDSYIGWAFASVIWGIAIIGMVATATCFVQVRPMLPQTRRLIKLTVSLTFPRLFVSSIHPLLVVFCADSKVVKHDHVYYAWLDGSLYDLLVDRCYWLGWIWSLSSGGCLLHRRWLHLHF